MLISMVILLGVTAVVMSGLLQTTNTEGTVQNRTEMHASVRIATGLLQQEIGQARRACLPNLPGGRTGSARFHGSLTSPPSPPGTARPARRSAAGRFLCDVFV